MRSISATEVPPNFITRRAMAGNSQAGGRAGESNLLVASLIASRRAKRRVYIPAREGEGNRAFGAQAEDNQHDARHRLHRRRRRRLTLHGAGGRLVYTAWTVGGPALN